MWLSYFHIDACKQHAVSFFDVLFTASLSHEARAQQDTGRKALTHCEKESNAALIFLQQKMHISLPLYLCSIGHLHLCPSLPETKHVAVDSYRTSRPVHELLRPLSNLERNRIGWRHCRKADSVPSKIQTGLCSLSSRDKQHGG